MNSSKQMRAFSLIELLMVISIISLLATLTGPALSALNGVGTTAKAISDLSTTIELARIHAMAHHTYVRVGFKQIPASSSHPSGATMVVSVYSADGSAMTTMATAGNWPFLSKPLYLDRFVPNQNLNGRLPDTTSDGDPFASPSSFGVMDLSAPDIGPVSVDSFIEFTPSGEARLAAGQSTRYIKIGIDSALANGPGPFIIRLSGINGTIAMLRKENM